MLVGATATQLNRHRTRIPNYIRSGNKIPTEFTDFSFEILGNIVRTEDSIENAASKLNLDSDKMDAAMFWFYNGNSISDELAFDAIKEADLDQVINIWSKRTSNGIVSQLNASAYNNLGTFYLSGILEGTNTNEAILKQGISLKLKFLESDFVKDFKELATAETFKKTKKELQLLFLNQVQSEIEKSKEITLNKLLDIIRLEEFSAKEDFLTGFVQKPIEQIEKNIDESKTKRKANAENALKIGQALNKQTAENLEQLKSILGISNLRYTTIADKLAEEILQCSIEYFNYFQENDSEIDYYEPAIKLAKVTEAIAVGKLIKDRIKDSLITLDGMKEKELTQAIQLLQSIKDVYEENKLKINQDIKRLKNDPEILSGRKIINYSAVEDGIKNAIDWQKANEMISNVLSDKNLKKIKYTDNHEQKIEFLELANWLKDNSQKKSTITTIIAKYKKIPPYLPFTIISSVIRHADKDNVPLPITNPLYKKHTRFIGLTMTVECFENKNVIFYTKYIGPDGQLSTNNIISPKGFTHSTTVSMSANTKTIDLKGWGDNSSCTYSIGEHRIEVYVSDFMIHSKKFVIDLAPSEKLEIELHKAEDKLKLIEKTQYFKSELSSAQNEMNKIKEWHFLRSNDERERQIKAQQTKINHLIEDAKAEKKEQIEIQKTLIKGLTSKILKAEY